MIDIVAMLLSAEKDMLQKAWDAYLVGCWYKKPNKKMQWCATDFVKEHKIPYEKFYDLKRIPRFEWHRSVRVTRFVAAHLPKLNTALWGGKLSDEELLSRLFKSDIDTMDKAADKHKYQSEKNEIAYAQKKWQAALKEKELVNALYESGRESRWDVCK